MKIILLVVGKTATSHLKPALDDYAARISHYAAFEIQYVQDIKRARNLSEAQQKQAEGRAVLERLDRGDHVILLDERGRQLTSTQFGDYVQKRLCCGARRLVFVVGGPYGFSPEVYDRADDKISLSAMTFPHELVRVIFVEQLYRAFTILNHEPYHHE